MAQALAVQSTDACVLLQPQGPRFKWAQLRSAPAPTFNVNLDKIKLIDAEHARDVLQRCTGSMARISGSTAAIKAAADRRSQGAHDRTAGRKTRPHREGGRMKPAWRITAGLYSM